MHQKDLYFHRFHAFILQARIVKPVKASNAVVIFASIPLCNLEFRAG